MRGEQFYKSNCNVYRPVTKQNFDISDIKPNVIFPGNINNINRAKLADVSKVLLTHYGEDWKNNEEVQYYVMKSCSIMQKFFLIRMFLQFMRKKMYFVNIFRKLTKSLCVFSIFLHQVLKTYKLKY